MQLVIVSAIAIRYVDFSALRAEGVSVSLITDPKESGLLSDAIREACASVHVVVSQNVTPTPVVQFTREEILPLMQTLMASAPNEQWRIITLSDLNLMLVAQLSEELNLPGLRVETLGVYHDKMQMKACLDAHGIRTPHHLLVDINAMVANPSAYYAKLVAYLHLPFILKPTDSAGSFGVVRIDTLPQFLQWCEHGREMTFAYEAEEFIEGMLYHCDSVVEKGEIIFSECCEYTFPNMEFKNNKVLSSMVLPPGHAMRPRLLKFVDQVLTAFGKIDTVSHMEVFAKPSGELVFLEIGARPPGAMSQQVYHHDFGVWLANAYFRVLFGIPYPINTQVLHHSFWAYFPFPAGKVVECVPPPLQSAYEVTWKVRVGDVLKEAESIAQCAGFLFATNDDVEVLYTDFDRLRHYQPLKVE